MDSAALLVVGNPTIDRNVVFGRSGGPRLGGTGAIAALALARFGNRVIMAGRVGPDLGDLLAPLEEAGVEIVRLPAPATLQFENVYPDPKRPERREQRAHAIPPPIAASDLAPVLRKPWRGALLGPLTPTDLAPDLESCLRLPRIPLAMDVQGFLRQVAPRGKVRSRSWPEAAEQLRGVTLLHAGDEEAASLLGDAEAGPGSAERLARRFGIPEVSVTRGASGAWTWNEREGLVDTPAFSLAPRVLDPTGCGDIFLAALFHARLQGWPLARAGRFAAMAAAINAYSEELRCATSAEVEAALVNAGG